MEWNEESTEGRAGAGSEPVGARALTRGRRDAVAVRRWRCLRTKVDPGGDGLLEGVEGFVFAHGAEIGKGQSSDKRRNPVLGDRANRMV